MGDTIETGKHVQLSYSIRDEENNEIIEQSDLPIHYQQGQGSGLFDALAAGLEGHKVGDIVNVTLTPEEGFGVYSDDLVYTDALDNVPEEVRQVGAEAQFQNDAGELRSFSVTNITDGEIVLDGNHPFAGKTVTFRLTVLAVTDEKPDTPDLIPNPISNTVN